MQRNALSLIFLLLVPFCLAACSEDERLFPGGPDKTADLIVYFKTDATQQQIDDFWNNVLSYPDPKGGGRLLRPGVGRLSRVQPVEGHEGIAVIFYWDTANSERAELRRLIDASPMVFTVLKDVAPINVKTLKA